MGKISLTTRTQTTWMSVLGYSHKCLDEQKYEHEKWLVGYFDEHKNFHYENPKTSKELNETRLIQPVYVLNPWIDNIYKIKYENEIIEISIKPIKSNDTILYKSADNPTIFEPICVINLENNNDKVIEKFLKNSHDYLLSTMKFKPTDDVILWIWTEDYWRRVPNSIVKRNMSTIYLPEKEKQRVISDLERFLSPTIKEQYRMFGRPYHRTYCFHGLAGTGKTSFIHALASTYNKNIAILPFDPKLTDSSIIDLISRIPENSFLVLEDFDLLFDESNKLNISLSALLNCLDGLPSKSEQIVFLTTNNYIKLNPIICRPGRIDVIVEFKEIAKQQLFSMLNKFFPLQKDKYEEFYIRIKDKNVTTCMVQHYLFERYPDQDILQNIESVFSDMIDAHRIYNNDKKFLYM